MADLKLTVLEEQRQSGIGIFKRWLPRLVVALLFVFVGNGKFSAHSQWIEIFDRIGLGQWFRYFTGALQIAGGILVMVPRTFPFGILMLASTMLGAMAAWVFFLGAPFNALIPGALLLGLLAVGGEELFSLTSSKKGK